MLFLVAAALVAAIYSRSLHYPLTRDDTAHFADVARWQRPPAEWGEHFREEFWAKETRSGLYRPLTALTIQAQRWAAEQLPKAASEPDSFPLRLGNLALLAAAAAMAGWLASRLGVRRGGALAVAAIVAVHPLLAEDALEIVSRSETQAALGVLLSAGLLAGRSESISWSRGAAAGLAFLFALGSKEGAFAAFPALLIVAGGALRPAMALGAALLVALVGRVEVFGDLVGFDPAKTAFVDNPLIDAPLVTRALTGIAVLGRQLTQFVWPERLSVDWSYAAIVPLDSALDPFFAIGAVALLLGLGWLASSWRRSAHDAPGAGSERFGLLLAGGSWFLVSNIARPVGTVMGERLFTLPAIGIVIALAGWSTGWLARLRGRRVAGLVGLVAITAIAAAGVRACVRVADWRDGLTLYEAAAAVAPDSARVQATLAHLRFLRQQPKAAAEHARRAIELLPDYGKPHTTLANCLLEQGAVGPSLAHLWLAAHAPGASSDSTAELERARATVLKDARVRLEFIRFARDLAERHPASSLYLDLAVEAERVERGGS